MPRLLGVEIPADKRIEASLTYIYGIGFSTARRILEQTNIDPNIRAKNLTPQQLNEIIHAITNNKIKIEGDLRRDVQSNLKRLQAINSYRGIRHRKGLPVRGQRTSTNARTRKGPRKTVGVIRNPEAKAGKEDSLEIERESTRKTENGGVGNDAGSTAARKRRRRQPQSPEGEVPAAADAPAPPKNPLSENSQLHRGESGVFLSDGELPKIVKAKEQNIHSGRTC
jgi:small subunit ribosomal protein S13